MIEFELGLDTCQGCGIPIEPEESHTRYGIHFCSPACVDIYDERNDYGHESDEY